MGLFPLSAGDRYIQCAEDGTLFPIEDRRESLSG